MLQEKAIKKMKVRSEKPAIVVKSVTKEFIIPHEKKTTLFENIKGAFTSSTYEKFVALKDVSFTVNKGDSIGIIGDNGSGKSTLLKIIAKILRPTSGSVEVNGRITPFLELGVGFQPDLTARENIEVYSTIMGLSDKEIAKNIDGVIEFAGLTKFADTKLKNFSSGMQVRLAFATAIQREPEILLVDEVLAVGDMDFQQKCLDVFTEYKKKGITMLFVSHDLNSVRKFCDKTMLLRNGMTVAFGDTDKVIDQYIYTTKPAEMHLQQQNEKKQDDNAPAMAKIEIKNIDTDRSNTRIDNRDKKVVINSLSFIDKYGSINMNFMSGDPMTIRIRYEVKREIEDLDFSLIIYNDADVYCYETKTKFNDINVPKSVGENTIDFIIDRIPMLEGRFFITLTVTTNNMVVLDRHEKEHSFVVNKETSDLGLFGISGKWVSKDNDKK